MKVDSFAIARLVGVSQATVSRAFSNPDKVSPATRQKILEAAETLGYKPDRNASALRKRGTNTILLLYIKREGQEYWTNAKRNYWLFSEAILALTSFFENQSYIFEVKQVNSVFSMKRSSIKEHCDGVIIFDFVTEEESQIIADWKLPYVLCHRSIQLQNFNHSSTDNRAGGRIQAEYLKQCGASSPVYVMNEEDPYPHDLRFRGFSELYPDAIVLNSSNKKLIQEELIKLIKTKDIDSAAFVNDMLLVSTVTRLYKQGIDLQQYCPVIGYDNSTELLVLDRRPASIDIGISRIYTEAARALNKLIRKDIDSIDLVHPPELVKPES